MILSILILVVITGCDQQVFDGNRTSNDVQFIMNYSIMNCTKIHEMNLEEGTIINVIVESKSGRLDILVTGSNGEKIYKADDAASGKFSLNISKTDTYKFIVTGKNAKGSISFKAAQ